MTRSFPLKIGIIMIIVGAIIYLICQLIFLSYTYLTPPPKDFKFYLNMLKVLSFIVTIGVFILYLGIALSFLGILRYFNFQEYMSYQKSRNMSSEVGERKLNKRPKWEREHY
jgi:hypothetical protein